MRGEAFVLDEVDERTRWSGSGLRLAERLWAEYYFPLRCATRTELSAIRMPQVEWIAIRVAKKRDKLWVHGSQQKAGHRRQGHRCKVIYAGPRATHILNQIVGRKGFISHKDGVARIAKHSSKQASGR